jgi:hypothetical protein
MSLLNSKFDIVSVDNPMALAAIAQVLKVNNPPAIGSNGTPQPGVIPPGAIIEMNSAGEAVLAAAVDIVAAPLTAKLAFVTLDGNTDLSGSFVQKLTVLAGGFTMLTDQFVSGPAFLPGSQVSYGPAGATAGKVVARTVATQPLLGVVGPAGLNSVTGVLQVIVPQGAGLAG